MLRLGNRRIEVLLALRTLPAVGFVVLGGQAGTADAGEEAGACLFTGDTAPNPARCGSV